MKNRLIIFGLSILFFACTAAPEPVAKESAEIPQRSTTIPQEQITQEPMKITSTEFTHNQNLPAKYSCDGNDVNPPLTISDTPEGTKSLVLIHDDPDAPVGTWVHWLLWNISPDTTEIAENSTPSGAVTGKNSWNETKYGGACPPSGTHRYFFKIYALDTTLNLSPNSKSADIEAAMKGHVLDKAELIGLYR